MKTRPKLTLASFFEILSATFTAFGEDRIGRHAAALAYFTVFSISPLLLFLISVAALVFGDDAARGAIKGQLETMVGSPEVAKVIQDMLAGASQGGARPLLTSLIATLVALWGASNLFGALQDSLNAVWGVMPDPKLGFFSVVRSRFVSFAMVLGVGFLLLVSLVLTTVLATISKTMSGAVGDSALLAQLLNFGLGLGVAMLLFAAIFKVLPDARIEWRDVWIGALVTATLFSIGRLALGFYLGRPAVTSAFGSAGALVVLLLWVNYASTILFVGAEFTKAYAGKFGSKIVPADGAVPLSPELRAKQGFSPQSEGAKGAVSSAPEVIVANKPRLIAKGADFEHTLSAVAGAVLVILWALRKNSRAED